MEAGEASRGEPGGVLLRMVDRKSEADWGRRLVLLVRIGKESSDCERGSVVGEKRMEDAPGRGFWDPERDRIMEEAARGGDWTGEGVWTASS